MSRQPVSLFLLAALVVVATPCAAGDYADELVQKADELELYRDPYWHILLHYERTLFGYKSVIDDPAFFAAPDGKRNPQAELHATIRSFFQPVEEEDLLHPTCRFVARLAWLTQELGIEASRLPVAGCETFRKVYDFLEPSSVTLIFPAAHINNPASMFGHTLLVFDSKDKNRLLSKSVSYAARLIKGYSPLFILGSFIGMYPGYYTVLPYYDKVEEYGDIGHRDMWEYELDLSKEETTRMMMHTWELQEIYSKYFFLGENCSYNLLYLLDAARPELALREEFNSWVIPVETVKAVQDKGIVRDVRYRPSKVSTIRHMASVLTEADEVLAARVARGLVPAGEVAKTLGDATRAVQVLDLATEFTQFLYTEEQLPADEYKPLFLQILKARSKLGQPDAATRDVPPPPRPDQGHGGNRLSSGAGYQDDLLFETIRWRPAYHSLLDYDAGYQQGAQIEFMEFDVRYYSDEDNLQLQSLDAINITSLSARDRFFKNLSWRVLLGFEQKDFQEGDDHLVAQGQVGFGLAYELPWRGLFYLLPDTRLELGDVYSDKYALGPGALVGAMLSPHERWKVLVQGRGAYFFGRGEDFGSFKVSLDQNLKLTQNNSVSVELSYNGNDGYEFGEVAVLWNLYF